MMDPPRPIVRPLDWDSTAFGFPVARIEGVSSPATQLDALGERLGRAGIALAYWEWPSDDPAGRAAAARAGGRFVNTRATLLLADPRPVPPRAAGHAVDIVTAPTVDEREALARLALAAGSKSRFALDAAFPRDRFVALYRTWMARSLSGELADAVIVARDGAAILGMITVRARDGEGVIGLFGVSVDARGRGVGRGLLDDAIGWAAERDCRRLTVATQGENAAALALYRAAGFGQCSRTDMFHFWKHAP